MTKRKNSGDRNDGEPKIDLVVMETVVRNHEYKLVPSKRRGPAPTHESPCRMVPDGYFPSMGEVANY